MTTKFVTPYNYKQPKGIINELPSMAYQEGKDDSDINILYKRYLSKGLTPPNIVDMELKYGNISNIKSFEELNNVMIDIENDFNDLPSDIREACDGSVDVFMNLIGNHFDDPEVQTFQTHVFDKLGMLERKEFIAEKGRFEAEIKENQELQQNLEVEKQSETI